MTTETTDQSTRAGDGNLPPLPDPKWIYHASDVPGEDDLYLFAESGDVGCEQCERLYTADQMRAYALAAAPAVSAPAIEHDEQMGRDYIPLPGGWELQTKGNGSTLRLLDKKAGERHPLPLPDHIVGFIERMAREVHAAGFQAPVTGDAA